MKSFQGQTYYELLEISVGATAVEVRQSFDRLTRLYDDDQVVLYGLIEPEHAASLRARLKVALETLVDDDKRDAYDVTIGLPPREPRLAIAPRPSAPSTAGTGSSSTLGWSGSFAWVSAPQAVEHPVAARTVMTYSAPPSAPREPVLERVAVPEPPPAVQPSEPITELVALSSVVDVEKLVAVAPTEAHIERLETTPVTTPSELPAAVEEVALPATLDDEVQVGIVPLRAGTARDARQEAKVKPFEVPPGVEINGDLLRQVRMARGLSMVQLSERTKISVKHLENVEGDRYDALPATVYLRGILMNLSRELGLDGIRVSKSYLTFVDAHRSKG